jgi:RNA polymerase sigma-70 factor, ECF subfamily
LITPRDGALPLDASSAREDVSYLASDHDLMAAVADGNVQAFSCLLGRHVRKMTALAQRITGNAGDADDIVQEAFLRLWSFASRWDPNGAGSVRTWLSRVVINLCLDSRRRKLLVPLEEAGELVDPSRTGFDGVNTEDQHRVVQELLGQLPERQRAVVVLCYFEEMSGFEIASVLGLSVGAVESLLVRARRTLKKGMKRLDMKWGEDL